MSSHARLRIGCALLIIVVVIAAAEIVSCRWALNWRVRNGLVVTIRDGRARVFAWDTSLFRIDYPPGLSTDEQAWHVELLPYLHWGQPPAHYAAPGVGEYAFAVPLWMIGGVIGVLGWRMYRAREAWQCRGCGYDLRGLARSACPECGRRPQ